MSEEISEREALNNLVRFRDHLSGASGKEEEQSRVYSIWVNRGSGELSFRPQRNWIEGALIASGKEKRVSFSLSLRGALDDLSERVTSEMLWILNDRGKKIEQLEGRVPEWFALADLGSIAVTPKRREIESEPHWHGHLSRKEAERILKDQPNGCYLLREVDEVSALLASRWMTPCKGYLVSLVEEEKIVDRLLVETDKGWLLYADEPNFSRYRLYPTLKDLISQEVRHGSL
jgi:hypothetical protein